MTESIADINTQSLIADVKVGRHNFKSNVNLEDFENEESVTPEELLAAALSSSICTELKRFAILEKLDIKHIHVIVSVEHDSYETHGISFSCNINYFGNISLGKRAVLLQIARNSKMYKMLSGKIRLHADLQ
jgi:organic hydroperoxide reductase OsmC/OhrA